MTKAEFIASDSGSRFNTLMRLTGLRPVTINNYARRVVHVAVTQAKTPQDLTCDDAEKFMREAALKGDSNINITITCIALKFYIVRVLEKPWRTFAYPRTRKYQQRRSRPLTRDEICELIDRTQFQRYRIMFSLVYGSGLRISEACALRLRDIDLRNQRIFIHDGKGGRHRETVLANSLNGPLQNYIRDRRPVEWLFPSSHRQYCADTLFPIESGAKHVSTRSAQRAFFVATKRMNLAGIVTIHSLRHSFATHLIEYSMPLFSVQRLLGHRHLRTTLGYLSAMGQPVVADFSPLDKLAILP